MFFAFTLGFAFTFDIYGKNDKSLIIFHLSSV